MDVECYGSIKSVKHIYIYIYEGHNTMHLAQAGEKVNKIDIYVDTWYISAIGVFMWLA